MWEGKNPEEIQFCALFFLLGKKVWPGKHNCAQIYIFSTCFIERSGTFVLWKTDLKVGQGRPCLKNVSTNCEKTVRA